VVFLTLRDPSADLSLTVTAHRDVLDAGAPELAEGARVTLHAKPEFYPARGTSACARRDPPGRPR
jgi:exodeoxyribonuclease VII large subunit